MKVIILGTGSPEGHPILLHPDEFVEKNESRLRPGLLIQDKDNILFDASPDVRQQLIHLKIKSLTAVFITHQHFDHLWGIGDLAQLTWLGKVPFKIYVNKDTLQYIKRYMPWINLPLNLFSYNKEYYFKNFSVVPRKVIHSKKFETAAFEIRCKYNSKKIIYAPDFKGFVDKIIDNRYEFCIIDGTYFFGKYIDDEDHLEGKELMDILKKIQSKKYYLLGISPWWYKTFSSILSKKLPANFYLPKDFMVIKFR